MLRLALVGLAALAGSWLVLVLLARHLPPGLLKARQVPRHVLIQAWPAEPGVLEHLFGPAPAESNE